MLAILCLSLGFVPPLAAGPLAGIVFLNILKRRKMFYQVPFWALLILLNLLVMYWVASSRDAWLQISSLSAFIVTPIASLLTVFLMRKVWHKYLVSDKGNETLKSWYGLGLVLIPVLQIGMFAALLIYGPWLCKAGLVICLN